MLVCTMCKTELTIGWIVLLLVCSNGVNNLFYVHIIDINRSGLVNVWGFFLVFQECDVTVHDINVFCVGKCEGNFVHYRKISIVCKRRFYKSLSTPDGVDSVLARVDVVSVTKEEDDVQIRTHGCKIARLAKVGKV